VVGDNTIGVQLGKRAFRHSKVLRSLQQHRTFPLQRPVPACGGREGGNIRFDQGKEGSKRGEKRKKRGNEAGRHLRDCLWGPDKLVCSA